MNLVIYGNDFSDTTLKSLMKGDFGKLDFIAADMKHKLQIPMASLIAQVVKNPPAMCETWIGSLGWKDSLEKGKATHSSILAWRIPGLYSPRTRKELDTSKRLSFHPVIQIIYRVTSEEKMKIQMNIWALLTAFW